MEKREGERERGEGEGREKEGEGKERGEKEKGEREGREGRDGERQEKALIALAHHTIVLIVIIAHTYGYRFYHRSLISSILGYHGN